MKLLCPVKKCVWGAIDNLDNLKNYIAKSGQFFGQDLSGPASNYNPSYPSNQTLYQYMGWGTHQGLDIPVSTGTEVFASHDGVVVKLSDSLTAGIGVVIEGVDIRTVYWHLKEYNVVIGQSIKMGEKIALSDNTGYSGGPHLHWEYKIKDGNDYKAVDPLPYVVFKKPMDKELVSRIVSKLYQTWLQDEPDAIKYWSELIDKPEILENLLDQKIKDIKQAVNK